MRELSELLADSVDARARSVAGLTPEADDFSTIVKTVRRRRVVRRSLQTLAVVPIVGALTAGVYLGLDLLEPETQGPAAPTDVVPPPATLGPLETGELLSAPGLPPYFEAPADLESHVGAGWTALVYRSVAASHAGGIDVDPTEHAVFLAAPDGALFRTVALPPELELGIVHWDAPTERARVTWTGPDRPVTIGWLDVHSGRLTTDAVQFDQWARFLGHASDGAEIWVEDPAYVDGEYDGGATVWSLAPDGKLVEVADIEGFEASSLDPAGTQALAAPTEAGQGFAVVDLGTGAVRTVPLDVDGQTCAVVGWLDDASVAALCHVPVSDEAAAALDRVDFIAQDAGLYRVDTAVGGQVELLHSFTSGEPVPEPWTGVSTGAGTFAFVAGSGFPGGCSVGVGTWDGAELRTVLGPGEHGSNMFLVEPGGPGAVLVTASQSCESSGVQAEVTTIDVATGAARVLTPWLDPLPADGIDYWHRTITSVLPLS